MKKHGETSSFTREFDCSRCTMARGCVIYIYQGPFCSTKKGKKKKGMMHHGGRVISRAPLQSQNQFSWSPSLHPCLCLCLSLSASLSLSVSVSLSASSLCPQTAERFPKP